MREMPTIQHVSPSALSVAPWNPRFVKEKRFRDLCASLKADPALLERRPILATTAGEVYAGNQRLRAALHLGWATVPVIYDDLSPAEAKARAVRDNSAAGEWVEDDLAALLFELGQEGVDLAALGADEKDILRLLDSVGALGEEAHPVPEPPAEPITRPGDLWLLGPHRLLCGDATRREDVERLMSGAHAVLMMTDPPYGVDYSEIVDSRENQKRGGWADIAGDVKGNDLPAILAGAFGLARDIVLSDAAAWFCWHPPGANSQVFRTTMESLGIVVHKQLIWMKPHFVFGRWEYHWQHETCWYGWREGHHPEFYGDRSESTVWQVEHEGGIKTRNGPAMASLGLGEHPTQKPPELWTRAIRNHTQAGEAIYEPFAGSGPAFTAAHQLGRVCYGLEIEPRYCDVIVKRWENLTGESARREGEV